MKKLYLITGAGGHLGTALIANLLKRGEEVRALVLPGEQLRFRTAVETHVGDVRNKESLLPFFANTAGRQPVVIHAAGIVSITSKPDQTLWDTNVTGTKNVVELCEEYGTKLVYISSVHAIPERPAGETIKETDAFDPEKVVGAYAKTKAAATQIVLKAARSGLSACVVHPSGIIGPYDYGSGHLTALITDYVSGKLPAAVHGGYDFVDVRDVAQGIVTCCDRGEPGQCYILSNRYYSIPEILHLLAEITGKGEVKLLLPPRLIDALAPLVEQCYRLLRKPPLFTPYSLYTLRSNAQFSHAKASAQLGYTPRDIKETLTDTVKWLKFTGKI